MPHVKNNRRFNLHSNAAFAARAWLIALLAAMPLGQWVVAAEAWYVPYEPDAHTIALFHLDGDALQQTNAGRADTEAILRRGASLTDGIFGRAASLSGPKQDINLTQADELLFTNDQPFTVECWIQPQSADGAVFSVGVRFYLQAHFGRGTARVGYRAESFPIRWLPLSGIPWRRGEWQHVAVTHDSSRRMCLYIDGALAASTQHEDEGDWGDNSHANFGSHDGWTKFMVGKIDEVRISDTVREFEPLLEQANYVRGEQVQLNTDEAQLPASVASIEVRVTDSSASEVFSRTLTRAEAGDPLFAAEKLGSGPAQLTARFRTGDGTALSTVERSIHFAEARIDALRERIRASRKKLKYLLAMPGIPEVDIAERHLNAAEDCIEERILDAAEGHIGGAERRLSMIRTGEAQYRATLRERLRSDSRDDTIRVTMSWEADGTAEEALAWAERLGANELVTPHNSATREGLKLWRDAGYHTVMLSGTPIHAAGADARKQHQFGYWCMDTKPAENGEARVRLKATQWGGLMISDAFDPAEHWLVVDVETGQRLPPGDWRFDAETKVVTVSNAADGHRYRVYYMMETGHSIGDPLYEPYAEHGLGQLREEVEPLEGVLETYWYDDLGYAWPGRTPQGGYDWESYTCAARPENQIAFTKQTGIEFDPQWLVMPPKTLDVPPQPEYFAWMEWVQDELDKWMPRATAVPKQFGMDTWLYWGDCHVGIEPYLADLAAAGVDEIDRPAGDPVTARALVDFPGDVYRRTRLRWLHDHIVGRMDAPEVYEQRWDRARRGLLMCPPKGLYWMPFGNVGRQSDDALREDLTEQLAQISDEFRLIGRNVGGSRAWEGGMNLYVAHSWGRQYSWRPWGDAILWHLTDLPVRVRFVSFRKIIDSGVPEDADALFLYGMPGTAWSGGYFWQNETLVNNVKQFVSDGGGLIGIQAPSFVGRPQPHWALADVFGLTGKGTEGYEQAQIPEANLEPEAVKAAAAASGTALVRCTDASMAGIGALPAHVSTMAGTVAVGGVGDGADVIYALEDGAQFTPGVVAHRFGRGRALYMCGHSRDYSFSRLVRKAVFWAARREQHLHDLWTTGGDGLFVYAYPDVDIVALLNTGQEAIVARVQCRPSVLGLPADGRFQVVDLATGEEVAGNADISAGFDVQTFPHCCHLLKVHTR